MNRKICIVFTLAAMCCTAAFGSVIAFDVTLDGIQAGTGSPGTGMAMVHVDDVANTAHVDLSFSGLLEPTTNAHIHCCAPPGGNAGVIIPFVPAGFPLGVTEGMFVATFDLTPEQVADLKSFQSYINIHTSAYPGGEIRGNLVPEPGSIALLGLGLGGVAALRYRRVRRGVRAKIPSE